MKICVVTPLYTIAGVPLAQLRFARALAAIGHEVDFLIGHIDPEYSAPEVTELRVINLNRRNVRGMLIPLWKYLRTNRPELVFSAEDHLNGIVLLAAIASGSKAKISGSSRVTPFDTYSNVPLTKRWILKYFMRAVMWRADALTCVSKDMVRQYQQVFNSPRHVDVYNIIDDKASRARLKEPLDHEWFVNKDRPILVAAGRLARWKGFADLIQAMKLVTEKRKVRLVILGDGPLKAELQTLIDSLGLSDTVQLQGYVDNPLKFHARANAFVLSSHVEGLPNVLVEAMMCGCTPVSTDCPTGPREVLQHGEYGYLVPPRNPAALAQGIEQALDRPIPNDLLEAAITPFKEEAVLQRHFEVLGIAQSASKMVKR